MTATAPVFETTTESTTDAAGRTVHVTVVTMDGLPAFSFVTKPRNGLAPGSEHVVSGVTVEEAGEYGLNDTLRSDDAPTTGNSHFIGEPTVAEVLDARLGSVAYERGYAFVADGPKGAEIPSDEHDGFYRGVDAAKRRTGRVVRNNRLTGAPRR